MRAVFDPNVLIAAALSPAGTPAKLVRLWLQGAFELVISAELIAELRRALAYPKIAKRIEADHARGLVELLRTEAEETPDPAERPAVRSSDPGDDYLIALSMAAGAALVSGDRHLIALARELPIYRPADFLELVDRGYPPGG